jgi:N-acetylneuraminate synthase/N,N'-diacetyllegionaminate synthase
MEDRTHFGSARNRVFYIAEIGGNHEGDFDYACELCDLAISSGADAVKFQLYRGDHLVSSVASPARNEHFKKFELTKDQHIYLAERVRAAGVQYMASVWDEEMLSWIDPYIETHKVGSGDLTCYPMLKALAKTSKPIILSTGLSSLGEVAATVNFIANCDPSYLDEGKLALLQCTSSYPTPDDAANLRVVPAFAAQFGLPIGYSDHTLGSEALEYAYVLGARIIEKHFTDTREGKSFRDHLVSLTAEETRAYLDKLGKIEALLGCSKKQLTRAETEVEHEISFRRSIYAKHDIPVGTILSSEDITTLRPKAGVCASKYYDVVGKVINRSVQAMEPIMPHDVAEN